MKLQALWTTRSAYMGNNSMERKDIKNTSKNVYNQGFD